MPHIHVIGGITDRDAPPTPAAPLQVEDVLAGAITLTPHESDDAEPERKAPHRHARKATD